MEKKKGEVQGGGEDKGGQVTVTDGEKEKERKINK